MKQFRVFIENLPETVSEPEIRSEFSNYGEVTGVEIKERKVLTVKHTSCFFAYVNLKTDEQTLQQCFQAFNETEWYGQYVKLQIAKESFLERLKRERESNSAKNGTEGIPSQPSVEENSKTTSIKQKPSSLHQKKDTVPPNTKIEEQKIQKAVKCTKKESSSSESSESSDEETKEKSVKVNNKPKIPVKRKKEESSSESSDSSSDEEVKKPQKRVYTKEEPDNVFLELKRPKREAKIVNGLLKIDSFGKTPIVDASKKDEKQLDTRKAEADAKRRKAVQANIQAYHQQKKQFAMFQTKPKIIKFTDDYDFGVKENTVTAKTKSKKVTLFESDDEENDLDFGKNIEDRIKSDDRFAPDERFQAEDDEEVPNYARKLKKKQRNEEENKSYIRYDPSNPEHARYEINNKEEEEGNKNAKKKKRVNVKEAELKEAPEVSKERAFSVNLNFKEVLGKNTGFSLSGLFGNSDVKEDKTETEQYEEIAINRKDTQENPFKYDSSDDEDETEQLEPEKPPPQTQQRPKKLWTEPFFLQENDFRYQEGMDFIQRIATEERGEGQFEQERAKFKEIIRGKIRNINKKNGRFKKKLGGSKKKKMKRLDKALKRT